MPMYIVFKSGFDYMFYKDILTDLQLITFPRFFRI